MEENNNEELQEKIQTESQQKDTEADVNNQEVEETQEEQKPSSNARFMLWTLAGIYLLYTGCARDL